MRPNAGMGNRQGASTCASRKSPPPQLTLAWLCNEIHSERSNCLQHIKTEDTAPDCPATKPRGPGKPPLIRTYCSSTQHQSQPLQSHRGPPASQPRSQRYSIAHGRPEASPLHDNPALHRSHHHSTADED